MASGSWKGKLGTLSKISLYVYGITIACIIVTLTLNHVPNQSLTKPNFQKDNFNGLNITRNNYISFEACISRIISNKNNKDKIINCSLSTITYHIFESKLGTGFGGIVFLVKLNMSSSKYYIMKYYNGSDTTGESQNIEVKAMRLMIQNKVKLVPKLYQYMIYSVGNVTKSFILMEYFPNTIEIFQKRSLMFFQNQPNITTFLFWLNNCFINNLWQTFKDMSDLGIFHGDFDKSDHVRNLLLSTNSDHTCYVIDFGSTFFMTAEYINSDRIYGHETPWASYYLKTKQQRLNILLNDTNNINLLINYAVKDVQYQLMKICVVFLLKSYPKIVKSSNHSHIHTELEWNYIDKARSLMAWGRSYSWTEKQKKWCKYNMIYELLSKSIFLKYDIDWTIFNILNISNSFSFCDRYEF
eukprot:490810_1